jgi:DNA-binding transcriptional ArsR family regulator
MARKTASTMSASRWPKWNSRSATTPGLDHRGGDLNFCAGLSIFRFAHSGCSLKYIIAAIDPHIKISLYPNMASAPRIFAALADPTRLRIVMLLGAMELSVGELAQVLGQSQPRVSRHVKILIDAGLAERRKEGSWVFLSLGPRPRTEPLFQLIERWAELDGDNPWFAADAARLAAVRADRAAAAERYFASHAGEWDADALAARRRDRGRGGDRPRARRGPGRSRARPAGRHRHRDRPDDRIVRPGRRPCDSASTAAPRCSVSPG